MVLGKTFFRSQIDLLWLPLRWLSRIFGLQLTSRISAIEVGRALQHILFLSELKALFRVMCHVKSTSNEDVPNISNKRFFTN